MTFPNFMGIFVKIFILKNLPDIDRKVIITVALKQLP